MVELAHILQFIRPHAIPYQDFRLSEAGIDQWNTAKLGPQPTQEEIDAAAPAAQAASDAVAADQAAYEVDKSALKAQFDTAAARLAQISNAASPTNPQVIQAVRDLATYQLKILKYMRKI